MATHFYGVKMGIQMIYILKPLVIGVVAAMSIAIGIWVAIKMQQMDAECGVYDRR
jgi:hypothetical protein